MRRRPRRGKSSIPWVVNARCVWRTLHCVNPSSAGFFDSPNERWLETLGSAPRAAFVGWQLYPSVLTDPYYEGNMGRTGNLEHIETHFAENAGLSKQGANPCMIAERSYYSKWTCNGFRRSQSNAAHVIPARG
jgi:hypothetical protein